MAQQLQLVSGVLMDITIARGANANNPLPYDGNLDPNNRLDRMEMNSKNYEYVIVSPKSVPKAGDPDFVRPPQNKGTGETFPTYRQKANTGEFSKLKEPMTLEHAKMICEDAGIDYTGIKVRIIDDPDMLNYPYTGYTHSGGQMVDLYPQAFTNRENLVKTLGHERIHVMQKSLYGEALDSNMLNIFENAAHGSEASWWQYYQSITGGN